MPSQTIFATSIHYRVVFCRRTTDALAIRPNAGTNEAQLVRAPHEASSFKGAEDRTALRCSNLLRVEHTRLFRCTSPAGHGKLFFFFMFSLLL